MPSGRNTPTRSARLPGDIRERYLRIQREAFDNARKAGWEASLEDND